ncbi:hypothetical protein SAMN05216490_4071 [Mucilaginibacter mallensis]|uniref:Uncharacterized protein n=1 Tax=Mucilaginibacter mallensis TaxID=652787 RepID=A0A1H2BF55_MUCMA|nr:hypothetical protein SAMN05216490_4071 [Mucilaginibacter mallensis]
MRSKDTLYNYNYKPQINIDVFISFFKHKLFTFDIMSKKKAITVSVKEGAKPNPNHKEDFLKVLSKAVQPKIAIKSA